jgi:predicted unusual protein kinase regulating ubiquinone biosynthesis (AarF/ABC1/UbiB family)
VPESYTGYDPALADKLFRVQDFLANQRFFRIVQIFWSLKSVAERESSQSESIKVRAANLTSKLIELGATFIKLGQFLSVRRDFLPVEVADQLELLQDRVPPFSGLQVRQTIESELGLPLQDIFLSFDLQPIASASIGQVHRANLKDGRTVAVKVQRPNLAPQFYQDIGAMRFFAKWAKLFRLKGDWDSWLELADQFGRVLFNEIDYLKEGRNADRIRYALRDRSDICIPKVFWKYTSRRVLTLEFLAGTKIDDIQSLNKDQINLNDLAKQLIDCYMEQVLIHGLFQADPHAGNLAVNRQGQLVIYDFGVIGEISENQREQIFQAIQSIVLQDSNKLVQSLVCLKMVKNTANLARIEKVMEPFLTYYAGKKATEVDFSHLEKDIDQIVLAKSLGLPANLAYLIRTNVLLEGIARTLKPDFSFVEAAKPALKRWLFEKQLRPGLPFELLFRRPRGISVSSSENSNLTSAHRPTMADEKTEITKLEDQLKLEKRNAKTVAILILSQLILDLCSWQVISNGRNHIDNNYFLIGNVLMGAIILWQLLKPTRFIKP